MAQGCANYSESWRKHTEPTFLNKICFCLRASANGCRMVNPERVSSGAVHDLASLSTLARERKSATFDAFAQIWEQDYLSLSKASTQSTMRGHIKRLKSVFGQNDMRQISTGNLQRVIASMVADEYQPKTIRNLWATVRLIWDAASLRGT
jgi:hypothetical protein